MDGERGKEVEGVCKWVIIIGIMVFKLYKEVNGGGWRVTGSGGWWIGGLSYVKM